MNIRGISEFVREFLALIDKCGIGAVERFDFAKRLWALGFEMDCGESFERTFGMRIGDAGALEARIRDVRDPQALGNGIFSMCRYMTHSDFYTDYKDNLRWLTVALGRLGELAIGTDANRHHA